MLKKNDVRLTARVARAVVRDLDVWVAKNKHEAGGLNKERSVEQAIQFWLDCGAPKSDPDLTAVISYFTEGGDARREEIMREVRESQADKNSAPRGRKVRKSV